MDSFLITKRDENGKRMYFCVSDDNSWSYSMDVYNVWYTTKREVAERVIKRFNLKNVEIYVGHYCFQNM